MIPDEVVAVLIVVASVYYVCQYDGLKGPAAAVVYIVTGFAPAAAAAAAAAAAVAAAAARTANAAVAVARGLAVLVAYYLEGSVQEQRESVSVDGGFLPALGLMLLIETVMPLLEVSVAYSEMVASLMELKPRTLNLRAQSLPSHEAWALNPFGLAFESVLGSALERVVT